MLAGRAAPGVLARAPRLRFIQALTAGVEGWLALPDLPAEVALTGARGTHRIAMPENILGALFYFTKPYAAAALDQRELRWTRRLSVPLAGKTLGIIGLGAIGVEVARKAAAIEMSVIGVRRTPEPVPHVDRVYGPAEADQVLRSADFVLLLLPVTAETRGYINRTRLVVMKPSAYLLNFGRGELIVDADLIEAVKARTIAGAVLDVFTTEPLPAEHPFWGTEGITGAAAYRRRASAARPGGCGALRREPHTLPRRAATAPPGGIGRWGIDGAADRPGRRRAG